MSVLKVIYDGGELALSFTGRALLSDLLAEGGVYLEHPCGGMGSCGKCKVILNNCEVLSCKTYIDCDAAVRIPTAKEIFSDNGIGETQGRENDGTGAYLCLDIGTTTLALALVSGTGGVIGSLTKTNPQRAFGADVISRIDYCTKHGVLPLADAVRQTVSLMIDELLAANGIGFINKMAVSGNLTMLHLFFGTDCSSMGRYPYTPSFVGSVQMSGRRLGLDKVGRVECLPSVSAFVGSDIVAGMYYIGMPREGAYNLLIDLGTNAEIVLFNTDKAYTTAAAAGPCFEGANISHGMSAVPGAISSYRLGSGYEVIGNTTPVGICATGLVDIIASLVRCGIIEESGYMPSGDFDVCADVSLTQKDVRELQLAKSAVLSAVLCLMKRAGIGFSQIEAMYVGGGFSAAMNAENAAFIGLVPKELLDRFVAVKNSSLLGCIKWASTHADLTRITNISEYVDLSQDPLFSELFFENMGFDI